jgi:hypothetical protein
MSTFLVFDKIKLKGSDLMGRPKGERNRKWSKEEKLKRNLVDHVGQRTLEKGESISGGELDRLKLKKIIY